MAPHHYIVTFFLIVHIKAINTSLKHHPSPYTHAFGADVKVVYVSLYVPCVMENKSVSCIVPQALPNVYICYSCITIYSIYVCRS